MGLLDEKEETHNRGLLEERLGRDSSSHEDEDGYSKIIENKPNHDLTAPSIIPDNSWTREITGQFKTVLDRHADTFKNATALPYKDHGVRPDLVTHMATGGMIGGAGHAGPDDRNVKAQEGEYVVNAQATKQNQGLLEGINSGRAAPLP